MTISMYDASAPRFINMLKNLSAILEKAQIHAQSRKIAPAVLLQSRLFPDMFPLIRQVQIATDHAKGAVARLAGMEVPRYEDKEESFDELKERIARTIAFIEGIAIDQIAGSEAREITFTVGGHSMQFSGMQYLLNFALPNFFFHVTTAYNILRHNGVEIGKLDFVGQV